MPELKGVQDFYLTAEGLGGETLVGNIKFAAPPDTSITSIRRTLPVRPLEPKSNYRDLKGRRFDKQIPYRVLF